MKKKQILVASMLGLATLGLVGVGSASAFGGGMGRGGSTPEERATNFEAMFVEKASILGMSVQDLKTAWSEGKTIKQLAADRGISEATLQAKMQELRKAQMKADLQALVDKGVLTQAQADSRLKVMEANQAKNIGGKEGRGGRGMHMR